LPPPPSPWIIRRPKARGAMGGCSAKGGSKHIANAGAPAFAAEPKRKTLDNARLEQVKNFLADVPLFTTFEHDDLVAVAHACELRTYKLGEIVIQQGEISDEFFLVMSGDASVSIRSDKVTKEVAGLRTGDYFGEVALLHDAPRAATIKVLSEEMTTLTISRKTFDDLKLRDKLAFPCRKAVGAAKFAKPEGPPPPKKSEEEREFIVKALRGNDNIHLFVDELTDARIERMVDAMWMETVPAGTDLIRQGDIVANTFYVVQAGDFEVLSSASAGDAQVVGTQGPGSSFGELGLLYLTPRAATVRAKVESKVWVIDRVSFKEALVTEERPEKLQEYMKALGCVPMFAPLLMQEREALAKTLVELQYAENEVIMQEGDPGECMFILCQGEVAVSVKGTEQTRFEQKENPISKWKARKALTLTLMDGGGSAAEKKGSDAKPPKKSKTSKKSGTGGDDLGGMGKVKQSGKVAKAIVAARGAASAAATLKARLNREQLHVFGDRSMVSSDPRSATVTAVTATQVLRLDVDSCNVLLGPLEDLLKRSRFGQGACVRQFGVICKSELQTLGLLGCGGFGAVYLVEHARTKETYALKAISKGYILQCGMEESVRNEKSILTMVNSPFIIRLFETYNGGQSLYFLMEAALGGELFATYNRKNFFGSAKHAQFYIAGAICAIEYLHARRVIYRDLKPENLILTKTGHIKLIDMGLAKVVTGKTYTTCGTPDYFAPEVLEQTGHNHAVDWWTVGILSYELMSGGPPFESSEPMQTYAKIKKGIDKADFSMTFPSALKALVKELCQHKPEKRLGVTCGGVRKIKEHAWFSGFSWEDFVTLSMDPPYKPAVKSNKDMANFKVNQADIPRQMKYKDPGTGWDRDFATCDEPKAEEASAGGAVDPKALTKAKTMDPSAEAGKPAPKAAAKAAAAKPKAAPKKQKSMK